MSTDIYSLCPCGSGKKLKFCCHAIADDMDRILRLMEGNQVRVALQQLEQLAKKNPKNAWVSTTQAMFLLDLNEPAPARDILRSVLEEHSDNELAIVLYAIAMIGSEGFEKAKRAVYRAFQRSAKKLPAMVSDLAAYVGEAQAADGHIMAAREHLALALRLAPEERRQQLFVKMLELDGSDEVLYPLRGTHLLPAIVGADDVQNEIRKGQKYAAVGCWSSAADVFTTLANTTPEQAELWHAAGLCRAWDGDEKAAAEDLHRAARQYKDFGIAVECETIAQILDEQNTTDVVEQVYYQANMTSVSRLLTVLDGESLLHRVPTPPEPESESDHVPVAAYLALNSPVPTGEPATLTIESTPRVRGQISIFDVNPKTNEPAVLVLSGFRGVELDEAKKTITAAAGELISWRTDIQQPQVSNTASAESMIFQSNFFLSEKIPVVRRRQLFDQFWSSVVNETWYNQSLRALGGKSPAQAVGDESLKVPLLGAIYRLDAISQRNDKILGLKKLCSRLGVEPLSQLSVAEETNLGGLSIMQLYRLPISQLNDSQLTTVVNRAMLIRQDETLYEILTAAVVRPACVEQFDSTRILRTLSHIALSYGRRDEAFSWLAKGRELPVPEGKNAFQNAWSWDMAELGTRLEDPSDPQLAVILNRIVHYYSPKVPQIRPHVEQMLTSYGVPSPWDSVSVLTPNSLSPSGGLWNPDAAEPVPASGGKLWLPGQ